MRVNGEGNPFGLAGGRSSNANALNISQNKAYSQGSRAKSSAFFSRANMSSRSNTWNRYQTKAYEELNKLFENTAGAATELRKHEDKLSSRKEDSLFEEAKKSGNNKEVVTEVTAFIENFNIMMEGLDEIGGTLNLMYKKQLSEYVSDHKEELEAVGITEERDGTLSIDKSKLESAELGKLEELFKGSNSFATNVSVKSIYVEASVSAGQINENSSYESYNNYNSGGYSDERAAWRNYLR